jgi:hypothetical protein
MKRKFFIYSLLVFLLGVAGFAAEEEFYGEEEFQVMEEEKIPLTKLEKAEAELEHMQEKLDLYKRVVRSVEREEAELKELKKIKMRDIKKPIK